MADTINMTVVRTEETRSTTVILQNNDNTLRYSFPKSHLKKNSGELYVIVKYDVGDGVPLRTPEELLSIFKKPDLNTPKSWCTYHMIYQEGKTVKKFNSEDTQIGPTDFSIINLAEYYKYTKFIGLSIDEPEPGYIAVRMGRPEET